MSAHTYAQSDKPLSRQEVSRPKGKLGLFMVREILDAARHTNPKRKRGQLLVLPSLALRVSMAHTHGIITLAGIPRNLSHHGQCGQQQTRAKTPHR